MAKPRRLVVIRWRKAKGHWELDYVGLDGKRHRPLYATEEAATEAAAELVKKLNAGLPAEGENPDVEILVKDYVPKFLKARETDLSQRTIAGYRGPLEGIVTNRLGRIRVRDLSRRQVKALLGRLREQTWTRSAAEDAVRRPYARDTIRLVKAALSAMLSEAVEDGILDVNPCLGMGRRKKKHAGAAKSHQVATIRPFSEAEQDAVLNAAGPWRLLFETMAKAGLRPSEAYALHVDDLDLEKRTLLVERALDLDGTEKVTKTERPRVVRLMRSLATTLRSYLPRLRARALKNGWGTPILLFPTAANTPQDDTRVAKAMKATLKAAGVSLHHVPYDFRHTYATLMLEKGAPLAFVAHQLGHSSPATTLRHYAHWLPEQSDQWVDLLEPVEPDSGTNPRRAVGNATDPRDSAGAGGGSRTRDLLITNQLLCH